MQSPPDPTIPRGFILHSAENVTEHPHHADSPRSVLNVIRIVWYHLIKATEQGVEEWESVSLQLQKLTELYRKAAISESVSQLLSTECHGKWDYWNRRTRKQPASTSNFRAAARPWSLLPTESLEDGEAGGTFTEVQSRPCFVSRHSFANKPGG